MNGMKKRIFTALAAGTFIVTLAAPAQAAEVRIGSYKGSTLTTGERSGLIIGGTARTVTSASPEIVTVENVNGFWVAVAKSNGTAILTATGVHGETASLTLTVKEAAPSNGQPTSGKAPGVVDMPDAELAAIRQEMIRRINEVRRENGVPELTVNDSLMAAAQERAESLCTYHDSVAECEAVRAHGYPHGFCSNITAFTGVATADIAEQAVTNWVNSPGHFRAMIYPDCDTIGVGVAKDRYKTVCYMFAGSPKLVSFY